MVMKKSDRQLLLTVGPTAVRPKIQKIISQPLIYHRSEEFIQSFERLTDNLKYIFQTEQEVIILNASGTGGMDATIANLFSPGESVLVVENGKFSSRWAQIAECYGLEVKRISLHWGKSITAGEISQALKKYPQLKAVFLTHCETSTGALTNLPEIIPVIRQNSEALVIVDAISSIAALPLKMDPWQIDVVVAASQKGLGLPPGLAFVALNKRLWRYVEQAELPRYYLDFTRARQALRLNRGSAYTPAIPLIRAAEFATQQIRQLGMDQIWRRQKQIANRFRKLITESGLSILPDLPADSLTVIKIEPPYRANYLISLLKQQYQIVVSRGQGPLTDKVIRVGHFPHVTTTHLDRFVVALQAILSDYELATAGNVN